MYTFLLAPFFFFSAFSCEPFFFSNVKHNWGWTLLGKIANWDLFLFNIAGIDFEKLNLSANKHDPIYGHAQTLRPKTEAIDFWRIPRTFFSAFVVWGLTIKNWLVQSCGCGPCLIAVIVKSLNIVNLIKSHSCHTIDPLNNKLSRKMNFSFIVLALFAFLFSPSSCLTILFQCMQMRVAFLLSTIPQLSTPTTFSCGWN